jgi:serine/threonine protein kinase
MPPESNSLQLSESEISRLKQWIETSLASNTHSLAAGYQGQTLIYRDHEPALVIKVPHGRGLLRWFHVRMLLHEYAVYKKLANYSFAPKCFGLIDNQYLVLEYIQGEPIRQTRPHDENEYFKHMLHAIERLHERGVAHMDLKKKDNLLVVAGNQPYLIDFGAAVIYQSGFHPLNHWRYKLAVRFDYNAWVKHKYHDRMDEVSDQDQVYYKQTLTEIVARNVKRFYKEKILFLFR